MGYRCSTSSGSCPASACCSSTKCPPPGRICSSRSSASATSDAPSWSPPTCPSMSRPRFQVEEIDRSYRLRNSRQSAASTLLRVPYGKSFTTVTYSASLRPRGPGFALREADVFKTYMAGRKAIGRVSRYAKQTYSSLIRYDSICNTFQ